MIPIYGTLLFINLMVVTFSIPLALLRWRDGARGEAVYYAGLILMASVVSWKLAGRL